MSWTPSTSEDGGRGASLPTTAAASPAASNIQVVCRIRPLSTLEERICSSECTSIVDEKTICVNNEDAEVETNRFTFDRVFEASSSQEQVYEGTAKPLIDPFLQGVNCTVFAYGQTGSGKTHTIFGPKEGHIKHNANDPGIMTRLVVDLFRSVNLLQHQDVQVEIKISILEIYMEQIRDLLQPSSSAEGSSPVPSTSPTCGGLRLRENAQKGVYVEDITEMTCDMESTMISIIRSGQTNRSVSSTKMNKDSSRSHCIIVLQATCNDKSTPHLQKRASRMFIVDLAGSEFVNKTLASGRVLQEAKAINKSLSALSNVIKALVEGHSHIPFRDSKLTRLLQDSLGGSSKTSLILTVSSSPCNSSETVSTLRFGLRAKKIKNVIAIKPPQLPTAVHELRMLYQHALRELQQKSEIIEKLQQQVEEMKPAKEKTTDESFATVIPLDNSLSTSDLRELLNELERQKMAQRLMEEEIANLARGMKSIVASGSQNSEVPRFEWTEQTEQQSDSSPNLQLIQPEQVSKSTACTEGDCTVLKGKHFSCEEFQITAAWFGEEETPRAIDRLASTECVCTSFPLSSKQLGFLHRSAPYEQDTTGQTKRQGSSDEDPSKNTELLRPLEGSTISNNQTIYPDTEPVPLTALPDVPLTLKSSMPTNHSHLIQLSSLQEENALLRQELTALLRAFHTLQAEKNQIQEHSQNVAEAYETLKNKANSVLIDTSSGKPTLNWKRNAGESQTLWEWLDNDKTSFVPEMKSTGPPQDLRSARKPQPTIISRVEEVVTSEFGFIMSWLEKFSD